MAFTHNNRSFRIESIVLLITYTVSALAFLSVAGEIKVYYWIIFCLLFAISVYFEYRKTFRLPRWLLTVLSLVVFFLALYRLDMQELVTQMLEALLILLAIKLLEEKKVRDYLQIYAIALLLLAGSGLLSLNIAFLGFYFGLILFLTSAAILLTYYAQDPTLVLPARTVRTIVVKSLVIPLLAIPLTLLMFVILPRTQYPLLNFLNRPDKGRTGFTDHVRLGAVSDIQEDSAIILRANMERINENDLYWRGIVLEYFDGKSWLSLKKEPASRVFPGGFGQKVIRQTVYLEPYGNNYLFSLDRPIFIAGKDIRRSPDFTYSSPRTIETRLKYDAISVVVDSIGENNIDEERYLQIPNGLSLRLMALAQSVRRDSPEKTGQAILDYFRSNAFSYSLKGLPVSPNPLEDFLFDTKSGNCEFFASALAILLRINRIPARLVGGYRGGHYNEVGQYYLVPQKYAHAWVEAYMKPKGWVRLDPTPVAFDAIHPFGGVGNALRLTILMDTLSYYWYVLVINYNVEKQFSLVMKLRSEIRQSPLKTVFLHKDRIIKGLAVLLLVTGATTTFVFWIRWRLKPPEARLLASFFKKMKKRGYRKKASQGLEEFVQTVDDEKIRQIAFLFVGRFQDRFFQDKAFAKADIQYLKGIILSL